MVEATAAGGAGAVRVLHVPEEHDYVAHLGDERVTGVEVVPGPRARSSGWSPSPALDAAWVAQNSASFDVLHLHFGFEGRTPEQLRELVGAVRAAGRVFVLTAHDLQNPHLTDQRPYEALLDVLVPAADAVVTLTPGAAAELGRRWDRDCVLAVHPHIAPLEEVGRRRPAPAPGAPRVVGVDLKSLRANLVALPVLRSLADAVARLDGVRLRVGVHHEALEVGFVRHDAELVRWLREADREGRLDLRPHDRLEDAALRDHLRALDVSVLAYGHGTHSGWLELCHDLGVPVVAAPVGYLRQQQVLVEVDLLDPEALAGALRRALEPPPFTAATRQEREQERHDVAVTHRDLYRRLVRERSGEVTA